MQSIMDLYPDKKENKIKILKTKTKIQLKQHLLNNNNKL